MAQTADVPPLTTDLIVVKDHSSYGRSAYAAQAISAGSIVICEEPLLSHQHSNENKVLMGMVRKLEQYIKTHPEIEGKAQRVHLDDWAKACGFWLSFCRASDEVQQQVLQDMFNNPQGDNVDSTAPMLRTEVQAEVLSGMSEEFTKILKIFAAVEAGGSAGASDVKTASSDPEVIRKVLLAAELNVHHMGASGVIYAHGSKLAHVCDNPNTTYMSFKGRGCFIATRDIAAGEVLTTTYLPDEMQLMSVFARKRYLWDTFSFECACPRCTSQLDKFSSLPCNRCATAATTRKEDGILPQAFVTGAGAGSIDGSSSSSTEPPCGLVQFDPHKADAAALREHYVHDHKHDHDDCCGCGHDHDHDHHHHNHDHKHKAADEADGNEAAAAAESAAGAAAAAAFTPWQCTKCGLQLPDQDTELIGDYKVIREAHARVEDWAYSVAMNFDPQKEDSQRHLNMLLSLVGPYHWAVHTSWGRQTEYFAAVLRSINQQIMQQQGRASAQQLEYLANSVKAIRLNVNRTWSWLTGVVGLSTEATSKHLVANLVPVAAVLLHVSSHMRIVPKLSAHHGALIKEMQDLAADLLAKAEPTLKQLRGWLLPEPHPLVRQVEQAQSFAAKAAEAAAVNGAAAAAAGGALSMDKLQEFLPAESAKAGTGAKASAAGSSKAKGKKKTAGKK